MRSLAFDSVGCRLVQLALKVASQQVAATLLAELRGSVRAVCNSPHANYVIQKAVEVLPTALAASVAEEICGIGSEMARHRYGCRVLSRLLEHHCGEGVTGYAVSLVDEVVGDAAQLSLHNYGHYVINSIIEHGSTAQRQRIAAAVKVNAMCNAMNRHASFVCENILTGCSADDCHALAMELLHKPGNMAMLAGSQFGCHVVRALLRLPGELSQIALDQVRHVAVQLQHSRYGRRLLQEHQLATAPSACLVGS